MITSRVNSREHVLQQPRFLLVLRFCQAVIAVAVLGLSAYEVSLYAWDGDTLLLFAALTTMIISVYIIVAEMAFPAMYNYWAILGLDIYAIIVWLSAASLGADALSGSILGDQFSTGAVPYTGGSNTFTSFPTATSSTTAATGFISLPTTTGAASNSSPTSPTSGTDPTGTQTCIYDPSTGLYDICYKKRTISLLGRATVDGISYSTTPRNALAAACGLGGLEIIFFIITLTFLGIYLHRHRRAGGRCSPNLPRRTVISGTYEGKDVELLQRGYYAYQEDAGEL